LDYIPAQGFHQKPSKSWPPPTTSERSKLGMRTNKHDIIPSLGEADFKITLDGNEITLEDQIQMYATNSQLQHPLVSPIQNQTLGGLPPMLILVGGGEILRDEIVYLAHKAANPTKYPPGDLILKALIEQQGNIVDKYPPTKVVLQYYDDGCHVVPMLGFTTPATFMHRNIAQFQAECFARAQRADIEIEDDMSSHSGSSSKRVYLQAQLLRFH
jgi:hypothetical protein